MPRGSASTQASSKTARRGMTCATVALAEPKTLSELAPTPTATEVENGNTSITPRPTTLGQPEPIMPRSKNLDHHARKTLANA